MESSSGGGNLKGRKSLSSLSCKFSGATSSPRKGVQKFYTKIRHKIEDSMPPKISVKLNKSNNNSNNNLNIQNKQAMNTNSSVPIGAAAASIHQTAKRSVSSSDLKIQQIKPIPPPRGSLINKKLQNQEQNLKHEFCSTNNKLLSKSSSPLSKSKSIYYENMNISANPNGLQEDSDGDYCPLSSSLNNSNLSLEDEIFEELEKVAHDEAKLNAVLKNFDKILADFTPNKKNDESSTLMTTSTPILRTCKVDKSNIDKPLATAATNKLTNRKIEKNINKNEIKSEGKSFSSHKPLQKSKTCSIIESRCILKKSFSNSNDCNERSIEALSISNDLQHFAALQVTKSLWNLQDFETFAKTGEKFNKFNKSLSSANKLEKKLSAPPSLNDKKEKIKQISKVNAIESNNNNNRTKSQLPRAKSVWEVSSLSSGSMVSPLTSSSTINLHSLCSRTSSGSKIPVKKINPSRLVNNRRSNSFCYNDQSFNSSITSSSSAKIINSSLLSSSTTILSSKMNNTSISSTISNAKVIQIGKVLPIPKRQTNKITAVNKIVKNLNEINNDNNKINIVKRTGSTNSLIISVNAPTLNTTTTNTTKSTNAIAPTTINLESNKKYFRSINSASSIPHSLNKIGIPMKASTLSSSITSPLTQTTTAIASSRGERVGIIVKTPLKSANSELSLNNLKSAKGLSSKVNSFSNKKSQQSDLLLNKCLEKGHEILRKVEAFGSVTKMERDSNEKSLQQSIHHRHHQQQQNQIKNKRIKETNDEISFKNQQTTIKRVPSQKSSTTVVKSSSSSSSSPSLSTVNNKIQQNKNENKFIQSLTTMTSLKDEKNLSNHNDEEFQNANHNQDGSIKKSLTSLGRDNVDNNSFSNLYSSNQKEQISQICYAKECTIQYPRLESCKIIPPVLCHPSQQHAELMVNVKSVQQPLRVHQDSMLCINSDIIRSEKDYHSDCSDDSGHISNENDELIQPLASTNEKYTTTPNTIIINKQQQEHQHTKIIKDASGINSNQLMKTQKGLNNKISGLLEKFESQGMNKDNNSNSSSLMSNSIATTTALTSSASSIFIPKNEINNNNNHNVTIAKKKCTTIKVAEVKPVKCIKSSMEIYPTYSTEVIIQIK